MGSVRAPESHRNKAQYLTLITNLKPSGVHVFKFIRKICVLLENTTELDPGPGHAKFLFSAKSYIPRSPESCRVLNPTKSRVPRSPESHEVLNPTKSWIPRSPWSSSGMPGPVALSLGGPVSVHRGSNPCIPGIQFRWLLDSEVFGGFPVGRQAHVYCGLGCLALRPFILLVVDRLRVAPIDLYSHSAVTPMTMRDDLLFCLLDAAWKAPFIPVVAN